MPEVRKAQTREYHCSASNVSMTSQPKKVDRKKTSSVAASRKPRLSDSRSPEVMPKAADETFVGEPIVPEEGSFSASAMAQGKPGLPAAFSWKGKRFTVLEVMEESKESGPCHHGSGEQYVRKHWFRIRTTDNLEMRIYFERQARSAAKTRWHLFSIRSTESTVPDGLGSAG